MLCVAVVLGIDVAVPVPLVAVVEVVGVGKESVGWDEAMLQKDWESCSADWSSVGQVVDMQDTTVLGNFPLEEKLVQGIGEMGKGRGLLDTEAVNVNYAGAVRG